MCMNYIEDILHYYVDTIKVNDKDAPILSSISSQVKRGLALTDKQYELVKNKLFDKKDILFEHNIVVETGTDTRLPLRQIDRSKYIRIVDTIEVYGQDKVYEGHKQDWLWIKVRFPFAKKTIVLLENITRGRHTEYVHNKGSHEHYYKLTPITAIEIVDSFENKNFEIDDQLIEYATKSKDIINNKNKYLPAIVDNHVTNIKDSLFNLIKDDCEELTNMLLKDRSIRYGLTYDTKEPTNLLETIAFRTESEVLVLPTLYNVNDIVRSVLELNRFPLVVLVDENECFDQVYEFFSAFNGVVSNEEQSVMFRVDSDDIKNSDLNEFVKTYGLNNWVDNNTKIVYIKKNKLPKVLLKSSFIPKTALYKTSIRSNNQVDAWIRFNCDLILYHDNQKSSFNRFFQRGAAW